MSRLVSDFLLAVLDPSSGRPLLGGVQLKAGLAGAAIVQLVLDERLRLAGKGEEVPAGRFVATRATADLGQPWLDVLERAVGHKPKEAVGRVGGTQSWKDRTTAIRDAVVADLTRREVVEPTNQRFLGLVDRPRWRVIDPAVRDAVLERVERTLLTLDPATKEDGALTTILHGTGVLPKVLPSRRGSWLRSQGKAVAQGSWATDAEAQSVAAVAKVISEVMAAAAAAGVVAATGAASG